MPTIGDMRRDGLTGFTVECTKHVAPHSGYFTFDELRLSDEMAFVDVPKWRRFTCTVCGRRATSLFPDWRGYRARGFTGWPGGHRH